MKSFNGLLAGLFSAVAGLMFLPALSSAHGVHLTCSATNTIGSKLSAAQSNAIRTLHVRGTCKENVSFAENRDRIILDGSGAGPGTQATIIPDPADPLSPGNPGVGIAGRGIRVINFIITNFTDAPGIRINRHGSARIGSADTNSTDIAFKAMQGNSIFGNEIGVELNNSAFASIIHNRIGGNSAEGVRVRGVSQAQIGFQSGGQLGLNLGDAAPGGAATTVGTLATGCPWDPANTGGTPTTGPCGGNDIGSPSLGSQCAFDGSLGCGNGGAGIRIQAHAQGHAVGNQIRSNSSRGVRVNEHSAAILADNEINANSRGVDVTQASHVDFGGTGAGDSAANTENNVDTSNSSDGIQCRTGGTITGVTSTGFAAGGAADSLDADGLSFGTTGTPTTVTPPVAGIDTFDNCNRGTT